MSKEMTSSNCLEEACKRIIELQDRVADLEQLYDIVTGPNGDGGKFHYLMQQLEKRLAHGKLTGRTKDDVDTLLKRIDGIQKSNKWMGLQFTMWRTGNE